MVVSSNHIVLFINPHTGLVQALVNVPALSERTLRRDIEASGFTIGPEVQVLTLYTVVLETTIYTICGSFLIAVLT